VHRFLAVFREKTRYKGDNMFELENSRADHWLFIFAILSSSKTIPYLTEIVFPLTSDTNALEIIAKDFILDLGKFETKFYEHSELNHEIRNLFAHTYEKLNKELGENVTEQLCNWGNQLTIDRRLELSVGLYGQLLFRLVQHSDTLEEQLSFLIIETQKWLLALIQTLRAKLLEVGEALDSIELSLNDEEKEAFSVFYAELEDAKERFSFPPYNWLDNMIHFFNWRSLLRAIKNKLNPEELRLLDKWFESQRVRSKAYSSPEPRFHLYGFLELLELI
jgi:hypothetical protein